MRSKRKGLTPGKAIAVYFLAFLLLTWHESGRIAGWFENRALKSESRAWTEMWFKTADALESFSKASGARRLTAWEAGLVDRFNKWPEAGRREESAPAASPSAAPAAAPPAGRPSGPEDRPALTGASGLFPPPVSAVDDQWPSALAELAQEAHNLMERPQTGDPARLTPKKVLLTGDSMMLEGLGPPLQKSLREIEGLKVIREGRYGTGLARLDAFDWLAYFAGLMKTHQPDLVIITLGANDCQDIVIGRKRHFPASDSWNGLYAERVEEILAEAGRNQALVVWVGLPVMGKEPFNSRIDNLNQVVEKECARHANCRFWSTWKLMTNPQGLYDDFLPDESQKKVRVRGKDKIHLTEAGGRMMTVKLLKALEVWLDFHGLSEPDLPPAGLEVSSPESDQPGRQSQASPLPAAAFGAEGPDEPDGDRDGPAGRGALAIMAPLPPGALAASELAELKEIILPSRFLGREARFLAVIPKGEPEAAYPGLLLLPPGGETYQTWLKKQGAQWKIMAGESRLIFIIADGREHGWYADSPIRPDSQVESHLLEELLPTAGKLLPLKADRLGVAGFGEGGHGALVMALRNPGRFKTVSSWNGFLDLTGRRRQPELKLAEIFGGYSDQTEPAWRGHSAWDLAGRNQDFFKKTPVMITVGPEDALTLEEHRRFRRRFSNRPFKYIEEDGPAGAANWLEALPGQVEFHHLKLAD